MATCCIHCGVEEGELHLSNCPEMRGAFERLTHERDAALAEVERLREENEGLRKTAHGWFESLQQVEKVRDQMASNWMDWQRRAVELESEMDMLKAEAEQLRAEILAQMTQQAQLQGEYDERQRDAERYRTIRRMIRDGMPPFDNDYYDEAELDAAIDAARAGDAAE